MILSTMFTSAVDNTGPLDVMCNLPAKLSINASILTVNNYIIIHNLENFKAIIWHGSQKFLVSSLIIGNRNLVISV